MKKNGKNYLMTMIGVVLAFVGLLLVKNTKNPTDFMKTLPYIMIGVGCGLFGNGLGNLIRKNVMDSNPEARKQQQIMEQDERNVMIADKARAKSFQIMTFVYGAVIMAMALMNVDMKVILILVTTYLFIHIISIYYRVQYEKQM